MRIYVGTRTSNGTSVVVSEDGNNPQPLDPKNKLVNHSPDGFEWGYHGSGPAQLSLALLANALNSEEVAVKYYQKFKQQVVSKFNKDEWSITAIEVFNVVAKIVEDEEKGSVPDAKS